MLLSLPLYHHQPSSTPPNAINGHLFPPFPISKNLNLRLSKTSRLIIIRSSLSTTKTLPQSAIQRIAEKLRTLGFGDQKPNQTQNQTDSTSKLELSTAGEIFVPLPNQLAKSRVGHTIDTSWSVPESPVPKPGSGTAISRYHELKSVWKREKELERKKDEVPTLAELRLPPKELRRLRTIGIAITKKLKVGKAGITEGIVNGIHERWRRTEVVKIVCEDICKMNMKRTHDVLETKTGGLVIWRSGSKILLYRGANYKYPYFIPDMDSVDYTSSSVLPDPPVGIKELEDRQIKPPLIQGVGSPGKVRFQLPGETQLAQEADRVLDGLGPRFTDWWGYDPLPIDGDLLPAMVPGYRKPFRLLPYGISPKLTNDEMTTLRRLGRPLPCHFALSRNRNLQGLAAAVVKLWEKCEIAKVAVKRGVQNTNSELMAEELRWLTGGTLISRDKDFIILYRGKDFLPSAVSSVIEERRKHVMFAEKESAADYTTPSTQQGIYRRRGANVSDDELDDGNRPMSILISEPSEISSPESAIERTNIRLSMALEKKAQAEKILGELERTEVRQKSDIDKEGITEEERFMLRKVGLRMKPFLLMGRRGVFDGTIENMHLHWKYRELVKVLCNERTIDGAHRVARILEAESGGIFIDVQRVSKGYVIIIYRGKNYKRPSSLRPQTLMNKKQALKHSIEAQRRKSLKLHVLKLNKNIDELKQRLVKDKDKDAKVLLAEESTSRLAGEEMEQMLSSDCVMQEAGEESVRDIETAFPKDEENVEDATDHKLDMTSENFVEEASQDEQISFSLAQNEIENYRTELESSCGSVSNESNASVSTGLHHETQIIASASLADRFLQKGRNHNVFKAENTALHSEPIKFSLKKDESRMRIPVSEANEIISNGATSRSINLSNRERLLLRKQALMMKKRPPFAVGRSNIVSGLAKAITAHFQKQPLAIVNVKGRAKGTSVQEMVLKLQEATRAVLVSQEPNKIILYRGWGAGIDPRDHRNGNARDTSESLVGEDDKSRLSVSPELIRAIRIECGLLDGRDEEKTTKDAGT